MTGGMARAIKPQVGTLGGDVADQPRSAAGGVGHLSLTGHGRRRKQKARSRHNPRVFVNTKHLKGFLPSRGTGEGRRQHPRPRPATRSSGYGARHSGSAVKGGARTSRESVRDTLYLLGFAHPLSAKSGVRLGEHPCCASTGDRFGGTDPEHVEVCLRAELPNRSADGAHTRTHTHTRHDTHAHTHTHTHTHTARHTRTHTHTHGTHAHTHTHVHTTHTRTHVGKSFRAALQARAHTRRAHGRTGKTRGPPCNAGAFTRQGKLLR